MSKNKGKKNDPPRKDPPRKDPPRKDPPRKDPPKREPPKKEPPRASVTPFQNIVNAASQKSQPSKASQKSQPSKASQKSEPPKQTIKIGGKKINVSNFGKTLNLDELKKLQKKTDLTPKSLIQKVKDKLDIKIGSGTKTYATSWQPPGTSGNGTSGNGNDTEDERDKIINELNNRINQLSGDLATGFENLGTLTESITQIGADADVDVAQAYADAQTYGYDKESDWRRDVANIEVKGKLDLQPIINAGLARVAEIEGQASRDVAETTGKYGLKSMETRSEADKALGKMQLAGEMYGLLGAAFG